MDQSSTESKWPLCFWTTAGICTALIFVALLVACGGGNSTSPCLTCSSGSVGHFVFTANAADGTVSALSSDKTSGTLTSVTGSPFAAGSGAWALAASSAAGRLYVANMLSGTISGFTMDSKNGKLSAVPGSPFPAELGIDSLAINPGGNFLYAVSQNSANLWIFSVGATGALTPLPGGPLVINSTPGAQSSSVVIDPGGKYLYATTAVAGPPQISSIYSFSIDSNTGALTPINFSLVLYGLANKSTFDPAGKVLLVTGTQVFGTAGGLEVFIFDSSTGGLTLGLGSPTQVGDDPAGAITDASGKYLYVPNTSDATISAFVVDSTTGGLTVIPGSPFPSGGHGSINGPLGITADTSGHFVFVCNASNDISVFSINSTTGVLTPIAGSPFPAGGSGPSAIAFIP